MIRREEGFAPLLLLNEASVVILPLPWASSKTVPSPKAPPSCAVPYTLPLLSMMREANGYAPFGAENSASVERLGVRRVSSCCKHSRAEHERDRNRELLRGRRASPIRGESAPSLRFDLSGMIISRLI